MWMRTHWRVRGSVRDRFAVVELDLNLERGVGGGLCKIVVEMTLFVKLMNTQEGAIISGSSSLWGSLAGV